MTYYAQGELFREKWTGASSCSMLFLYVTAGFLYFSLNYLIKLVLELII